MKKEKSKQLTIDELIKYNQEVLIHVFENRFDGVDKRFDGIDKKLDKITGQVVNMATKSELKSLENKFDEFKNETLTSFDKVLNK
jgi:hypothetical protein